MHWITGSTEGLAILLHVEVSFINVELLKAELLLAVQLAMTYAYRACVIFLSTFAAYFTQNWMCRLSHLTVLWIYVMFKRNILEYFLSTPMFSHFEWEVVHSAHTDFCSPATNKQKIVFNIPASSSSMEPSTRCTAFL